MRRIRSRLGSIPSAVSLFHPAFRKPHHHHRHKAPADDLPGYAADEGLLQLSMAVGAHDHQVVVFFAGDGRDSLFPLANPVQEMVIPEVGSTPIRNRPTAQRPYFSGPLEKNSQPVK